MSGVYEQRRPRSEDVPSRAALVQLGRLQGQLPLLVRRHGQPQTRNHDTGANYEWKPARRQINARCSTIDNCPLWMPLAVMARRKSPKPLKRLERVNGIEPSS